jgi:hypothetical protein
MSDWAFVEHATKQLMRPRPGDSKGPTFWPSEASATYLDKDGKAVTVGKCRRAIFFRYLIECYKFYDKYKLWSPLIERLQRESKPVDRYMLWIWAAGEQAEEYLIEQAKKSGVYVEEQIPVYVKSHAISGKKDIEVFNPETGKLSIIEAKSVYGFGGNTVLGTESQRRRGFMGEPRDSNLMQIAIYHWWSASMDDAYEESRLVYIARDTGRYAEYLVRTIAEGDINHIEYRPWHPHPGPWVRVPYTINDILNTFEASHLAVESGRIPTRDFDLVWSEDRLAKAYEAGELGKGDTEQYAKAKARLAFNSWANSIPELEDDHLLDSSATWADDLSVGAKKAIEALANCDDDNAHKEIKAKAIKELRKISPKKELKELEKGDWQCQYCKYSPICYAEGEPKEL